MFRLFAFKVDFAVLTGLHPGDSQRLRGRKVLSSLLFWPNESHCCRGYRGEKRKNSRNYLRAARNDGCNRCRCSYRGDEANPEIDFSQLFGGDEMRLLRVEHVLFHLQQFTADGGAEVGSHNFTMPGRDTAGRIQPTCSSSIGTSLQQRPLHRQPGDDR